MTDDDLILEYWDDLPREMRVEALVRGGNQREIMERAAQELGLDFQFDSGGRGHVSKDDIGRFAVAVMDEYGD